MEKSSCNVLKRIKGVTERFLVSGTTKAAQKSVMVNLCMQFLLLN